MWCGGGGTILHVSGDGGHPVKAAIDGLEAYSYTYGGRYWCKDREDNYDLVGFVYKPLSITEADVGKLFKLRNGDVWEASLSTRVSSGLSGEFIFVEEAKHSGKLFISWGGAGCAERFEHLRMIFFVTGEE